ncbi:MAG: putative diguanylate cyclase YegE [Smithella sp. PtaU1.Bin162]|nr:MAG: putative diguanylate cyclase YegE [Smithella sp. PtaU1.Bin162]
MTNPRKKNHTRAYLERRIRHLEDVERSIVDGLEMAASLGDFQNSISKLSDVSTLLEETKKRVQGLIPFEAIAFFMVEEASNDFIMKYVDAEIYRSYLQSEVEHFIDEGTFAWALREKRPIIVPTRDNKGMLLHVMATTTRIRGMCVALLPQYNQHLLNTSLSLLSTVLLNSANAIESFELYRTIREINSNLERIDNYRLLFAAAPDGVEVLDAAGNILDSNDSQTKLLGYMQAQLLGSHSSSYFAEGSRASFTKNHLSLKKKGYWEGEVELVTAKGDVISVWRKEKAIYDKDRKFIGAVVYNRDITERKRMEAEIISFAITDPLTGLHNRRGFLSLAEQQLKLAERKKQGLLLYFFDLDELKSINDTLGHQEGDKAIIETAAVLKDTFRASDIVARLGGDEYAALAVDVAEANAKIFTDRLQVLIDKRNRRKNRRYKLSISAGCSYYNPENACSLDELMSSADRLMYEQKQNKKGPAIS